jgi:hypothetical protein
MDRGILAETAHSNRNAYGKVESLTTQLFKVREYIAYIAAHQECRVSTRLTTLPARTILA